MIDTLKKIESRWFIVTILIQDDFSFSIPITVGTQRRLRQWLDYNMIRKSVNDVKVSIAW